MNESIITFEELKEMFGYKTLQSLELFLIKNKINYIRGHGTLFTTIQAINEKLLIIPDNNHTNMFDDFKP